MSFNDVEVTLDSRMELAELVEIIASQVFSRDAIMEFILALDSEVADYDFTVRLRDHLNEAIKLEEETPEEQG